MSLKQSSFKNIKSRWNEEYINITSNEQHAFLKRKQINEFDNIKLDPTNSNILLIPLKDINILGLENPEDDIVGFQEILSNKPLDGKDKKFVHGSKSKLSYYPFGFDNIAELAGQEPDVIFITESFSNGYSIHKALKSVTGITTPYVMTAFSLTNIEGVLVESIKYFNDAGIITPQFILIADNDFKSNKLGGYINQGISKCIDLKKRYSKDDVSIEVFIPAYRNDNGELDFKIKYDVNDIHVNHSIDELIEQFNNQFCWNQIKYTFDHCFSPELVEFIKSFGFVENDEIIWGGDDKTYKLYHDRLESKIGQNFVTVGNYIKPIGKTILDGINCLLIEFKDTNNQIINFMFESGELADSRGLIKKLLNAGYKMNLSYPKQLQTYLNEFNPDNNIIATKQIGWLNDSYVLPQIIIGGNQNIRYYGSLGNNKFLSAGTLDDWRKHVASHCIGYPILELALYIGFSSLIINFVEFGFGLHLHGNSSNGKTTALRVASSIFGNPKDYMSKWNSTHNGIEFYGYNSNHTLCVLDEINEAVRSTLDAIYMLIDGQGKIRAILRLNGVELAKSKTWRTVVFSSGEASLEECALQYGKIIKAGELVRMIDIEVNNVCKDKYHADLLIENTSEYHGIANIAFIKYIQDNNIDVKAKFKVAYTNIISNYPNLHGQASRVAKYFALMCVSGDIAVEANILTKQFEPYKNILNQFDIWYKENTINKEQQQVLKALAQACNDPQRFIKNDQYSKPNNQYIGFYDDQDNWYIVPTLANIRLWSSLQIKPTFAKKVLESSGLLSKPNYQPSQLFMGGMQRKLPKLDRVKLNELINTENE